MALTLSVDDPDPATDAGLKLPLVRRGSPLTLKLTLPLNPAPAVTVTV